MFVRAHEITGSTIHGKDGEVGKVHDLYFDQRSWNVRYVAVETGSWLLNRKVLICPSALAWEEDHPLTLSVDLTRKQVENSPDVDVCRPVSHEHLDRLHRYYGWPAYPSFSPLSGPAPMGAVALVTEDPRETCAEDEACTRSQECGANLGTVAQVRGYRVQAADGEIGHVEDVLVDNGDWGIHYLVIDTRNWLPGKKVLVSPSQIDTVAWEDSAVVVKLSRDRIQSSPEYEMSALS